MTGKFKTYWQNFIGGEWVDGASGERICVENPATGEKIAEVARAVPADVDRAVAAARRAFDSRVLAEMRPVARGEMMFEVARHLTAMTEEIAVLECVDNGKTLANARND